MDSATAYYLFSVLVDCDFYLQKTYSEKSKTSQLANRNRDIHRGIDDSFHTDSSKYIIFFPLFNVLLLDYRKPFTINATRGNNQSPN